MQLSAAILVPLLLLRSDASKSGAKSQTICYGDVRELRCDSDYKLEILGISYNFLEPGSSTCVHVDSASISCGPPLLASTVKNECAGRSSCLLSLSARDLRQCLSLFYLTVLYKCESPAVEIDVDTGLAISTPNPIASTPPFNSNESGVQFNVSKMAIGKSGLYLVTTQLLMSVTVAVEYMLANQRQLILCAALSVSGGCILAIIFLLTASCWSKYKSREAKADVEDGTNGEVASSVPLLSALPTKFDTIPVSRGSGVTKGDTHSLPRQVSTLPRLGPNRSHEVLSTIRRSHSIDEGTQTVRDATEEIEMHPQTLSEDEARELVSLVDTMKFYNNLLEEDLPPSQIGGRDRHPGKRVKINSSDNVLVGHQGKLPSNSATSLLHRPPEITTFSGDKRSASGFSATNKPAPLFMASAQSPLLNRQQNGLPFSEVADPVVGKSALNSSSPQYDIYATPHGGRYAVERTSGQQASNSGKSSIPSELSYQASNESSNSIDMFSPDSIFNGDTLRYSSLQRQKWPRRGDGYSYIGGVFGV